MATGRRISVAIDDPDARDGCRPAGFEPQMNPFYVALPYNDMAHGGGIGRRPRR